MNSIKTRLADAADALAGELEALSHRIHAHPELGRHLRASITTGLYCSYTPPDDTIWRVERASSPTQPS